MSRHDTIYNSLLGALAFLFVLGSISMFGLAHSPNLPPASGWVFKMTIYMPRMRDGGGRGTGGMNAVAPRGKLPAEALHTRGDGVGVIPER